MKRYPVYKDSGIDWLGEIPEHWQQSSIRGVTKSVAQRNRSDLPLLAVYRDYGVIYRDSRDDNHNRVPEDLSNYKVVKPGNLVLNKMKTWQGSLGVSEFEGIVSPAYIICEVSTHVHSRFIHYLLRCYRYIFIYNKISYGVRVEQWDMHYEDFKQIPIFLPSVEEQKAIAHFIDRKLEEIDHFIRNKQRLIELLNEQKTAIINRAVTKGINPNAPMKHSGIEWLGEIPAHWEVIKISRIAKVVNGTTPDKNRLKYWKSGSIPWISSGKVNDYIITQPTEKITEAALKECSLRIMPAGSVVIGLVGQGKTRGKSARLAIDTCINQNLACIIPKLNLDSVFLHFVLIALYNPIRELARGGNQEALNCQIIGEIRIPFPPISEQQVIAAYIDMKSAEINISINQIQKSIELIQEYRTTLISDAVTGKIDVRGFDNANDTANSPKPPELATM
ncbi:restriction endonuclease subunit S [Microcoleus sp. BROC3]|uniref:restriction endonuclease subunit S n=1 Tax=Microcoleus sp. BROC3 TaxID=3055323 RepID=UPI002FCEC2DD